MKQAEPRVVPRGPAGRDAERSRLRDFLGADAPPALLIGGEPGIGKTTLWDDGVATARELGLRVLAARASEPEVQLSFVGLADLLADVDAAELADVPPPQRRALEAALLRADPTGAPPDSFALPAGFTRALCVLAASRPVLVAVDDLPWLDRPTADVLAFAARRIRNEPVRFLLARRSGEPTQVERALEPAGLDRLELAPLSLGALRVLLAERLGLSLPRRLLRHVHEATGGNPLFALELGRRLLDDGPPEIGEALPVPESVEELLGSRVSRLGATTRRLLLATALGGELRTDQLPAIAPAETLEEAVDAGAVILDGDRLRPSHPLLAAAAVNDARPRELRELHRALAGVATDGVIQARHLALAASDPDAPLADRVAAAAAAAGERGASQEALVLWEHALRLTPPDSPERPERMLSLAHHLAIAGERTRLTDLLTAELDALPSGSARARAWLMRPAGTVAGNDEIRGFLERALEESVDDPPLHASVLGNLSFNASFIQVARIPEAEKLALEALDSAYLGDAGVERSLLYALAAARSLRGLPLSDICERFEELPTKQPYILATPGRIAAVQLVWRGEVAAARQALTSLLALADERGEALGYVHVRMHLCELELRTGGWAEARAWLDEWGDPAERESFPFPFYERYESLLASGLGRVDEADGWASETLSRSERADDRWGALEARRAQGVAALAAHEPASAVAPLRAVWEHTQREGIDEPGAFPVAPELVEALVELGELGEARSVTERLGRLSQEQEHPWGLATTERCRGLLALAGTQADEAADLLGRAVEAYRSLGLRFDEARSLLALGRGLRRLRKWAAARDALQEGLAAFEAIGSDGWADAARNEIERVGARRPIAKGALTASERRVVTLAAEGLANKEIAAALHVTVNTVETHLKHAYAKLGVRSRSQLAKHVS